MENNLIFFEVEQPLKDEDIMRLERRLDIKLPELYRDHLLKHNGGYPNNACFSAEQGTGSCIHYFYAIYDGEYSNFYEYYFIYKVEQQRMPNNIIPVAYDESGNQICISVSGDDLGVVYFWDHEEETQPATYENLYKISDDFNDFLDKLH